jgi:DNA primase
MSGAKDPDEYIKKFGADHFRHLLNNSDGAINFELNKCREGIDTSTELGKIDYLKKVYRVLAGIKSPVERDIYISKVSSEEGISKNAMELQINSMLKKEKSAAVKKDWNRTVNFSNRIRDTINPEANVHPKEAQAESGIIYYLLNNPDYCKEISARLPAERFVTSFNKRVYQSILAKNENLEDCSVSSFNGEFSPEEVGKITGIIEKFSELDVNYEVVNDIFRFF